jgi:hypothetical protein
MREGFTALPIGYIYIICLSCCDHFSELEAIYCFGLAIAKFLLTIASKKDTNDSQDNDIQHNITQHKGLI